MDFAAMAELCAPGVDVHVMHSIATVESSLNPYAIGVVGARLRRQPRNLSEAVATARMLETQGYNFSLGVVQVNRKNLAQYGLTQESAFDPCANLRAGSAILLDCFKRAPRAARPLGDALSCYYSGNFETGYRHGYVDRVQAVLLRKTVARLPALELGSAGRSASRFGWRLEAGRGTERPPDPLFVTQANSSFKLVAPGDISTSSKSGESALLF